MSAASPSPAPPGRPDGRPRPRRRARPGAPDRCTAGSGGSHNRCPPSWRKLIRSRWKPIRRRQRRRIDPEQTHAVVDGVRRCEGADATASAAAGPARPRAAARAAVRAADPAFTLPDPPLAPATPPPVPPVSARRAAARSALDAARSAPGHLRLPGAPALPPPPSFAFDFDPRPATAETKDTRQYQC